MRIRSSDGLRGIGLAVGILATILLLALVPAAAWAAPSEVRIYQYFGDPNDQDYGIIEVAPPRGDRDRHRIAAWPAGDGTHFLSDTAGIVISPPQGGDEQAEKCAVIDAETLRCGQPAGFAEPILSIGGGARADLLDARRADATLQGNLKGGPGADRLLGGSADDLILGGPGGDVLVGYGGQDSMDGRGGPDLIRARDGLGDDITCGRGPAGREEAIRDRFDKGYKWFFGVGEFERLPISC